MMMNQHIFASQKKHSYLHLFLFKAILLMAIIDSSREPFNMHLGGLFYLKDVLLIAIAFMCLHGVGCKSAQSNVLPYWIIFYSLLIYYFVFSVLDGLLINSSILTRFVKKFYLIIAFLYAYKLLCTGKITVAQSLKFYINCAIFGGILSVCIYFLLPILPLADSQKVSSIRFVVGQPSITSYPSVVSIALMLSYPQLRSHWKMLCSVFLVLVSVSGVGLITVACLFIVHSFYNYSIKSAMYILGSIAFLYTFFMIDLTNYSGLTRLESAKQLLFIKLNYILGGSDPSMSLRDHNYSIARQNLTEVYLGHGTLMWKNYIPWIENTYRVILLETGIFGMIICIFAIFYSHFSRNFYTIKLDALSMNIFIIHFLFAFTLDILHVFTIAVSYGFLVAIIRYNYENTYNK